MSVRTPEVRFGHAIQSPREGVDPPPQLASAADEEDDHVERPPRGALDHHALGERAERGRELGGRGGEGDSVALADPELLRQWVPEYPAVPIVA